MKSLLLAAVMALPLFGQGVDIAVEVEAEPRSARLQALVYTRFEWDAAVAPENVVFTVDAPARMDFVQVWADGATMDCAIEERRIRCAIPPVPKLRGGAYFYAVPTAAGTYTTTASVTSTTPDPNPSNNTASAAVEMTGLPSLKPAGHSLTSHEEGAVSPDRPASLFVVFGNDGEPATDVVLRMTLPEGGSFLRARDFDGPMPQCDTVAEEVVCRWPSFEWGISYFHVDYLPPARDDGGTFPVRFEATAAEAESTTGERISTLPVSLRRRFVVSNGADEGAGSLRQAMLDANLECAAKLCTIDLRTSEPIRPTSPLPELAGYVKIDGGAVGAELDGSLLPEGYGITGRTCELRIVELAIRNFPGHAIESWPGAPCGSSPSGLFVRQNQLTGNLRGVVVKRNDGVIEANTIRDNRRAGIYIDGSYNLKVLGNEIVGNFASGVFVNLSAEPRYYGVPPEARIHQNVIHHNGEWGVCRTTNGWVELKGNSIAHNFLYGYDVGLDLNTPNRPDDRIGVPNKPVLFSATYDPVANQTVVRGRSENVGARLDLYASSSLSGAGYPDAEESVYSYPLYPDADFEIVIPRNLQGKWITATITRTVQMDWTVAPSDTSELSDALRVE